jgi:hypothetical protein
MFDTGGLTSLKQGTGKSRLTDNGAQRADTQLSVQRNRNRNGRVLGSFLHNNVAASLSYLNETMLREGGANLAS